MCLNRTVWLLLLVVLAIVQCRSTLPSIVSVDNFVSPLDLIDDFAAPTNHAKVARDLVHQSDWASFGTVSTINATLGYPMVSITSVADSARGANSTGLINFFVAKESLKYKDLLKLNKATLLFTDAQNGVCQKQNVDPMEPTCVRAMISGTVSRLVNGTASYDFGRSAFISRHPAAHNWLEKHDMVLCVLEIQQILVIDFYGGSNQVSVEDYYNYKSSKNAAYENANVELSLEEKFPIPTNHAKVARQLVHAANWTSIGTISTLKNITGYPMVSVSSVADSRNGFPSTGHIYFFLAKESLKYKDLIVKNQAAMLFSEAHTMRCQQRGTDPMEPTCMRAMIAGKVVELKNGTAEFTFARAAFVDRHPVAENWLEIHGMILCTLEIQQILVIDFYGGSKHVTVEQYFKIKGEQVENAANANSELEDSTNELSSDVTVVNDDESHVAPDAPRDRVHIRIHKRKNEQIIDIYV